MRWLARNGLVCKPTGIGGILKLNEKLEVGFLEGGLYVKASEFEGN